MATSKKIDENNLAVTYNVTKDELLKQKAGIEARLASLENHKAVNETELAKVDAQLNLF